MERRGKKEGNEEWGRRKPKDNTKKKREGEKGDMNRTRKKERREMSHQEI